MNIIEKDVKKVAELARLRFSEDQIEPLTQQLNNILKYFEKLKNIDTADIIPTTHAVNLSNVFRQDNVKKSLAPEGALKNAPESEQSFFEVPKIIEV